MSTAKRSAFPTQAGDPGTVEKIELCSVVMLPSGPRYGSIVATTVSSPTRSVPRPSTTSWAIGARTTPSCSPISCARSASGPPSLPEKASTSACICSSVASSSTYSTCFQLPARMLPGMNTTLASVSPLTSTPRIVPVSRWYATTELHVPLSGSSPIQQGHRTSQLHASSSVPWNW